MERVCLKDEGGKNPTLLMEKGEKTVALMWGEEIFVYTSVCMSTCSTLH